MTLAVSPNQIGPGLQKALDYWHGKIPPDMSQDIENAASKLEQDEFLIWWGYGEEPRGLAIRNRAASLGLTQRGRIVLNVGKKNPVWIKRVEVKSITGRRGYMEGATLTLKFKRKSLFLRQFCSLSDKLRSRSRKWTNFLPMSFIPIATQIFGENIVIDSHFNV